MAPLLELDDPAHVNAASTISNSRTPLFGRLPLEIRISIYEYALAENDPIRPQQIAQRSNKFFWETGSPSATPVDPRQPEVTRKVFVFDFSRTCRQIYFELGEFPVFYRVNTFDFFCLERLTAFLTAITPQRRAFIRNIVVRDQLHELSNYHFYTHGIQSDIKMHQSAAALISQCEDLRDLELHLPGWHLYSENNSKAVAVKMLKFCIECSTTQPTKYAVWNLPYIRPILFGRKMYEQDKWNDFPDVSIDLTNLQYHEAKYPPSWVCDQDFQRLLQEARRVVGSLRQRLAAAEAKGDGYRAKATPARLIEAINSSQIDFPGEERILRDRFSSTTGAISTRTRQKCRTDKVDNLGRIQRSTTKYDAEGILTWNNFLIHEVRWNGPEIECYVEGGDRGTNPCRSWEVLNAVLTHCGKVQLSRYYEKLAHATSWADPVHTLQIIRDIPSPQNIIDVAAPVLRDHNADKSSGRLISWMNYFEKVTRVEFDQMVETLEQAAEAATFPNKKRMADHTTSGCESSERAAKRHK